MLALCGECLDGGIRKLLPAQRRVTVCLMRPHRQRGIQQQHPLFCPARQIACSRDGCAEVCLNLLEDVLQRRRKHHPVLYGKTQPVSLSWLVIRILTDDDHLHLVERTEVEGIEDQSAGRIAGGLLILLSHGLCQLCEIGLLKLLSEMRPPRGFDLYIHRNTILAAKLIILSRIT